MFLLPKHLNYSNLTNKFKSNSFSSTLLCPVTQSCWNLPLFVLKDIEVFIFVKLMNRSCFYS